VSPTASLVRFCGYCGTELPAEPPATCTQCGRGHWRNAKPCAGALVVHDGKLLLVQRGTDPYRGMWDVPGGYCEAEEHPYTTALRELREETGLAIRITGLLGMWIDDYGDPNHPQITLNVYYHAVPADAADGEPLVTVQEDEIAGHAWFAPDDVPREMAFPGHIHEVMRAWRHAIREGDLHSSLRDTP